LLTGIGWGGSVVYGYGGGQELAVKYALLSVLLTILGSLGLFSGLILHSLRGLVLRYSSLEGEESA
jgi:hypothetical protein